MQITVKQEQKRIAQLIELDSQADKENEQSFDAALAYISKYLTAFFAHYAAENELTVNQTMQRVSKWDLKQWQSAVNDLEVEGWLPEAKKRVTVLGAVAGLSVGSMMSAIAGLAVVSLFSKQIKSINERVTTDQSTEIDRMQRAFDAPKSMVKKAKAYADKVQNEPLQPRYEDKPPVRKLPSKSLLKAKDLAAKSRIPLSQSLWNDADQLMNDLENMLLDNFKGDMSIEDLHRLVEQHTNLDQFNPKQNIYDWLHQQGYQVQRLIRTESARMKDRINDYYYKQNGIKYVNWVCEPGACAKCLALSIAGPYLIDEAPRNPDDSHPNCRCGKVPALDAKDWLPTELNKLALDDLMSNDPVEKVKSLSKKQMQAIIDSVSKPQPEADEQPFNDSYRQNMLDLAKKYGYDALPSKISQAEFDKLPDSAKLYRGTDRANELVNGDLEYSTLHQSLNGHGIYFSNSLKEIKKKYLSGNNKLVSAAMKPDIVLVDQYVFQDAFLRRLSELDINVPMTPRNGKLYFDAVAMRLNVDGWYNLHGNKLIIINRGKLAIVQ